MPAPEFSRPVPVDRLGDAVRSKQIEATPEERAALARRFSLPAIEELTADFAIRRPNLGPIVTVDGRFRASVVQVCVVSLEPFSATVEDDISLSFTLDPVVDALEIDIDAADPDEPEPLEGGRLDLGELAAQHLSLALDPHPRAPGVAVPDEVKAEDDDPDEEEPSNPFAALAALKRGK